MKFKLHLLGEKWIIHSNDDFNSVEEFTSIFNGARFVNLIAKNNTMSVNIDNILYIEEYKGEGNNG